MKVPKMYKSSDLYDAGTDVIYDDDSKLQYAPFVYATSGNGDGGDGGDEEGEDYMIINAETDALTGNITTDKTIAEISDALNNSTPCFLCFPGESEGDTNKYHLVVQITGDIQMALLGDSGSYQLQIVSGETNIWSYPD